MSAGRAMAISYGTLIEPHPASIEHEFVLAIVMRIAIYSDSFLPYISGVTTSILNQAHELVRLGHQVEIYRPKPKAGQVTLLAVDDRIQVHDLPFSVPWVRFPDLRCAMPLMSSLPKIKAFRPDVIHTHTEFGCGWEGVAAARLLDTPLVATFNTFYGDPEYLSHLHQPMRWAARKGVWHYLMTYYNRCHALISPSDSALQELRKRGLKIPGHLIPNGGPEVTWLPDSDIAKARQQLGLSEAPCFVYVGRVSHEKSLDVLLHAFRKVINQCEDAKLLMIGDGPYRSEMNRLIRKLDLRDSVLETGMVPHDKLIKDNILRVADVFVSASKTENHPVSVLESLMFGLPMIGPEARGMPEIIKHDENGLIFAPDDVEELSQRMLSLATDIPTRERLAAGALQSRERYRIGNVVNEVLGVYDSVIASRETSGNVA